jgi:isopenicillin-N epimerase
MQNLFRNQFLLDPDVHFLNHGSFGACPKPVFETLLAWQTQIERQPVLLLDRKIQKEMQSARAALGAFLHCAPEDVVYFPNPTTAVNMVARSLDLRTSEEVLASDHEYGAMDRTWRFLEERHGFQYRNHPISLPVTSHETFVEDFWARVSPSTRVIFLSHITSQTALIFPVQEICRRAREAGILTIIDGAHAPGQIPVDLMEIGADIYTGACHKWMCAPKGSAFLFVDKAIQPLLEPLVVSWGYQAENPSASQFVDYHEWQGTRDMSAFLSVPAAIEFLQDPVWQQAQARCHEMALSARQAIHHLTGLPVICPDGNAWIGQMAAMPLPEEVDIRKIKDGLFDQYRVEVPVYRWQGRPFLRISVQPYNSQQDLDALVEGLVELLKE